MKKFYSIILAGILLFGMSACGGDDGTEVPSEIIGEWSLQNMSIGVLDTSNSDIKNLANELFNELSQEFYYGETIEFNSNGTGTFKGESIKYSVNKSVLTLTDEYGSQLKYAWIVFDGKLILTLNIRDMLDNLTDELTQEQINYIKSGLKQFTIDFTYTK